MNTPAAFASLVWISVLGLALFGLVAGLSRILVPWAEGSER
jgi:NitT/TauT family transport system permease protein